jgi:hypothetical protein
MLARYLLRGLGLSFETSQVALLRMRDIFYFA